MSTQVSNSKTWRRSLKHFKQTGLLINKALEPSWFKVELIVLIFLHWQMFHKEKKLFQARVCACVCLCVCTCVCFAVPMCFFVFRNSVIFSTVARDVRATLLYLMMNVSIVLHWKGIMGCWVATGWLCLAQGHFSRVDDLQHRGFSAKRNYLTLMLKY